MPCHAPPSVPNPHHLGTISVTSRSCVTAAGGSSFPHRPMRGAAPLEWYPRAAARSRLRAGHINGIPCVSATFHSLGAARAPTGPSHAGSYPAPELAARAHVCGHVCANARPCGCVSYICAHVCGRMHVRILAHVAACRPALMNVGPRAPLAQHVGDRHSELASECHRQGDDGLPHDPCHLRRSHPWLCSGLSCQGSHAVVVGRRGTAGTTPLVGQV